MRKTRAAAAVVFLAVLSCGQARSVPGSVQGRWESNDPRYAGRTLEIGRSVVRFLDGNAELDTIVVRAVELEGEPGTAQRFVIEGSARDGAGVELALELQIVPDERLRIETSEAIWRRAGSSSAVPR